MNINELYLKAKQRLDSMSCEEIRAKFIEHGYKPKENIMVKKDNRTSLEKFKNIESQCEELVNETPLERLRFFCSYAMNSQDWVDVEEFFIALENQIKELENDSK